MDINSAFPSAYLKAADLQNREVTVTMSHVRVEDIGGDQKPVLYFMGKERGLVLNKTNSTNIADAYGPETEGWQGCQVTLFPAWVDFQGRSVQSIRVRPAGQQTASGPPQPPQGQNPFDGGQGQQSTQQQPQQDPNAPLDDSIPF